jgi:hypothetical protein
MRLHSEYFSVRGATTLSIKDTEFNDTQHNEVKLRHLALKTLKTDMTTVAFLLC